MGNNVNENDLADLIAAEIPPPRARKCMVCVLDDEMKKAIGILRERGTSYEGIAVGVNKRLGIKLNGGSVQHHMKNHLGTV